MFLLTKPTDQQIDRFRDATRELGLSYPQVGCTRGSAPPRYKIDHNRVKLGHGPDVFDRAVAALKSWKHFELGWARLDSGGTPLAPGTVVAVIVNHIFLWSLNACRVIYVVDDRDGAIKRFGFAYGTLWEHAERGEERFLIEWDTTDDSVWYDILAFSQPRHWLARIGYPVTRWWQKRFARDSLRVMRKQVEN